jgi:signal transduction histidine kinase
LDVSGEWLQLVVWQGFTEDMVTKIEKMPADAGLSGWAFTQDEPLILDDVNADWRTSPVIRQSALTVYAGVPMNVKGKIVGVLNAFREKRTPFHAEDIALLTSVADQVGISVENARLRTAKDQLIAAEERNQLARDLHDSVTQSLYSLTLFAEVGRRTAEGGDLRQTNIYLKRIGETAQQTLKEMRLLVYKLRPPILVEQGLIKALQHRLNGVEGRAGISTRLIAPDELILPDDVAETLFFIAQEALNNALKHAAASTVVVKLEADLVQVVLTVSDNGNGFDYESVETGGMGLTSMRERAELNAGNFQINSVLGKGTTVTVILPHERV